MLTGEGLKWFGKNIELQLQKYRNEVASLFCNTRSSNVFIFVPYPVSLTKIWFLQFYIIVSQVMEGLA